MSALGLASLGAQCANKALGMASLGVFCGGVIDVPNPIEPGSGAQKYYSPSQNSDQQNNNNDLLMMLAQSIFYIID